MAWKELADSRPISIRADGVVAHRKGRVDFATWWDDLKNASILYGSSYPFKGSADPNAPVWELRVRSIELTPQGATTKAGREYFDVDIEYSTGVTPQQQETGFIETSYETDSQALKKGSLWWKNLKKDGKPVLLSPENQAECIKFHSTLLIIKKITIQNIEAYMTMAMEKVNKLNNAPFLDKAKETIMFRYAASQQFTTAENKVKYRVTLGFAYNPLTFQVRWNDQAKPPRWDRPYSIKTSKSIEEQCRAAGQEVSGQLGQALAKMAAEGTEEIEEFLFETTDLSPLLVAQ
jgi:hypothetical protein